MTTTTDSLFQQLNPRQAEAVRATDGPVLVLAGAGSGKTRTLTYKIAYLIRRGLCRPEQVLAVTFTNKAAGEMRERVLDLVPDADHPPLLSTFHSFCVRVLRRYAPRLGWGHDFLIMDADDQLSVYKQLYSRAGMVEADLPVRAMRAIVSRAKNRGWGPAEYEAQGREAEAELVQRIFPAYQRELEKSNAMDFDDLLLHTVRLFREFPEVHEQVAGRFRYLLIDEYQDTNQPQYDLVRSLAGAHHNLTAVGDEDQSIYGFRGADVGNILRFHEDFPEARTVKLEQNYRSTQVILDAATAIVSHNTRRRPKVLWTEQKAGEKIRLFIAQTPPEEAHRVAVAIGELYRAEEPQVAVLYRTNFQSRLFEEMLRRYQIPYDLVGGISFYSRKEVKDALAYLRYVRSPADTVSLLRILNEPPRGIGARTVGRLQELAAQESVGLHEALQTAVEHQSMPTRTHRALANFQSMIGRCRKALEQRPLHLAIERILEEAGYLQHLREQATPEAEDRLENLGELVTSAREFVERGEGLQEFLDSCALYADTDDYDGSARVHLMTLHNAKGLEFDTVFLAGLEEGLLPHSLSADSEDGMEEERRLCYVGVTRARRRLFLSYSRTRRRFGKESNEQSKPSRFLQEIPTELIRPDEPHFSAPARRPRKGRGGFSGKTYDTPESVGRFLEGRQGRSGANGFRKGALVQHREFGRGKVLRVERHGDDWKVTVHFSGVGIKKLLQRYAKLTPA